MNNVVRITKQGPVASLNPKKPAALGPELRTRPIVRLHLLGPMRATTYLGNDVLPAGKRARAVLGYLCLAAGEDVQRARLAALLWDRIPDAAARANLRQALRELTLAFGTFGNELIVSGREIVRLNVDACWVDALAILGLDPSALDRPVGDLKALCRGELLQGLDGASPSFDDWLLAERTRVAERLQSLLERELEQAETKDTELRELKRALSETRERTQALREITNRREARQRALEAGRALPQDGEAVSGSQATDATAEGSFRQSLPEAHQAPTRDRLRIGVLPFLAYGTEREENLAFSVSQEIAAALSRFRWFDIIAPISLMPTPAMRFVDERQFRGRDLDYVIDGSMSSNGKNINISVRLMDVTEHVRPVWSESFELEIAELHRLDEFITTRIAGRIDPVILFIEGKPKRRDRYGATGLLLLAMPMIFSMERRKYEEAGELIERALEIDPDNSMAAAWAAHWHLFYVGQGWAEDTVQALAKVRELALKAIRLDPDNAEALGIYAHCCAYGEKDFDTALYYFDRALRLNPSLSFIWAFSALTYCYIGDPTTALQRLDRYRELTPTHPYASYFETVFTIAYTFNGDYERAVLVGRRVVKANPNFVAGYKPLLAALGHLGRYEEAKPYVERLLLLEPAFTAERFGQAYPFKKDSDRRRYMKGLVLAGVPER